MEGVVNSNGTCCMMNSGESGSGLCSMTMMMQMPLPLVTSHHAGHHHHLNLIDNLNDHNSNTLGTLLVLPSSNNNNNLNIETISFTRTGLGSYFMENGNNINTYSSVKAKIMAHPYFHRLLTAYSSCQKVGAPPEVVSRLEELSASMSGQTSIGCLGEDPVLDQFMEAYCEMLSKYEQQLYKPFKEAVVYFQRIERQLKALTLSSEKSACNDFTDRVVSSGDDVEAHSQVQLIDPQAEDQEIKGQLLRKYSVYLGSLKQEFMKKRKKGKLPKEARQQLLEWWSSHYKWPYPSESQKLALAESTGLDQKQINNWFINQRKRHWKPSVDMQFVVMDAAHSHCYMDNNNVWGSPFPMDLSSALM